ncbi:MAG: acyltransferase [Romboutsia sp.]
MQDNLISKNKSLSLKFVAVILMILFHTFAFPDRIKDVEYISLLKINGQAIEFYIAKLGIICVGMFTFLSGYGLYVSYNKNVTYKGVLKRIYNIYLNYWVVFIIFIPIGLYMNRYVFNLKQFIMNFIGISDSYNGEWWFLRLYIMLLIMYPLIIKITKKLDKYIILSISLLVNIIGLILSKIFILMGVKSIIINLVVIFLRGQFLFILGIIIAKYGIYTKLKNKIGLSKKGYYIFLTFILVVTSLIIEVQVIDEVAKLILVPIIIFILANIISENSILSKLGKHSTNMWLTHSFFCYYLFQEITFIMKYSIVIIIQLIFITIIVSIIVNKFLKFIKIY